MDATMVGQLVMCSVGLLESSTAGYSVVERASMMAVTMDNLWVGRKVGKSVLLTVANLVVVMESARVDKLVAS